jgi:predicted HAD superfamily hydrolase
MRISSFDIFDTVITRSVAEPHDIFLWCGIEFRRQGWISIDPRTFARLRVQSEKSAKDSVPHREVLIEDIYAELAAALAWDSSRRQQAMTAEIELEARTLNHVPIMRARVTAARETSDRIAFISDMYLPESFLESILIREGLHQPGDLVYVSGARKCSKSTGRLFTQIRSELPAITHWEHTGDNSQSDVDTPRRLGIEATEFPHTKLSRYERLARGNQSSPLLWRSQLAGAMRMARLHCPPHANSDHAVIWNTGSNVVGPLLYGFVQWCLNTAVRRGIGRLYFVARDGQILLRIAQIICNAQKLPIDCRYLFGSRQAWRPASIDQISVKDLDWIAPKGHRLTTSNAFARIAAKPEEFASELTAAGFSSADWSEELSESQIDALGKLLLRPDIASKLNARTRESRRLLIQYLAQAGFFDGVRNAIVDIGWYGNLQRCLGRAIAIDKGTESFALNGLYFGLFPNAAPSADQSMQDYWSQLWTLGNEIQNQNITLFECFTAADHGSVVGYQARGDSVEPRLQALRNQSALDWGLSYLQGGILEFCNQFSRHEPTAATCASEQFQGITRHLWNAFQINPSADEAKTWGQLRFTDQCIEEFHQSLAPHMTDEELRESISDYTKRPTGWWAEGTLALTKNPALSRFLMIRRTKRALVSATNKIIGPLKRAKRQS